MRSWSSWFKSRLLEDSLEPYYAKAVKGNVVV